MGPNLASILAPNLASIVGPNSDPSWAKASPSIYQFVTSLGPNVALSWERRVHWHWVDDYSINLICKHTLQSRGKTKLVNAICVQETWVKSFTCNQSPKLEPHHWPKLTIQ